MDYTVTAKVPESPMENHIRQVCKEIADLVVEKNRKYGNSALEPVRIFSIASTREQIFVRIDDKLSRLKTMGINRQIDEDTIKDLMGYLILLEVHRRVYDE